MFAIYVKEISRILKTLEIFVQSMYVKMYYEYITPYLVQAQSYESGSYSDAAI